MTDEVFQGFRERLLDKCNAISDSKVRDYAHDGDRLDNFKRIASDIGQYPELILLVYMHKHMDSIHRYIRDLRLVHEGKMTIDELDGDVSEQIEGRLCDAINYLILLGGLLHERREA